MGQADITPSRSDHATWFANDRNDPLGDSETTGNFVSSLAAAIQQYVTWAWSEAFLDSGGRFFGGPFASAKFSALLQYVSHSTTG